MQVNSMADRTRSASGRAGLIEVMSNSSSRRSPDHYRYTGRALSDFRRTIAYRPVNLSQVLTQHYRRAHPPKRPASLIPVC